MNNKPMNVTPESLTTFVTEIFRNAGCNERDAGIIGSFLVQTNLWGIDSHGVLRVMGGAGGVKGPAGAGDRWEKLV